MAVDIAAVLRASGIPGAEQYAEMFGQLPAPIREMFAGLWPELQACAETDDYPRFVRAVKSLNMGFDAYAPILWGYRDAFAPPA